MLCTVALNGLRLRAFGTKLRGRRSIDDVEQNKFIDDVVAAALQIQLVDALGGARRAFSFPGGDRPSSAASPAEIERAKEEAEVLIRNPTVLECLCPALRSVS